MNLSVSFGRIIRWGSVVLVAASLIYLGLAIEAAWPRLQAQLRREMTLPLLLAAMAHVVLLVAVALGWAGLVVRGVPHGRTLCALMSAYGTSQLAKYLPGNVFHLVGRQVLGRTCGASQTELAAASMQEVAAMAVACGTLAVAADLAGTRHLLPLAEGIMVAALALGVVVLATLLASRRHFGPLGRLVNPGAFLAALASHGFFLGGGAAIAWMLAAPLGAESPSFGPLLAVWCWAYLAGFVTPAAPGGIGVREAVFVALLPAAGNPEFGLALALALRLVSAVGDLLFAALAAALGRYCR